MRGKNHNCLFFVDYPAVATLSFIADRNSGATLRIYKVEYVSFICTLLNQNLVRRLVTYAMR
jgi:hypothetical protein